MHFALGLEIGGTKLQAGVGRRDGRLLSLARRRVDPARGAAGIREALPGLVGEALAAARVVPRRVRGIGVGFGGPVDASRGVTLRSHQIRGWDGFPLRRWLENQWRAPVAVENDASLAAYAEALRGAGRGRERVLYVTVGSGVGGGLVTRGAIERGQGLGAAEIGHTWVPDPRTGRAARLEDVASGWSIARRAREAVARGERTALRAAAGGDGAGLTAERVHEAAQRGDRIARALLAEAAGALAISLCNAIALWHPERIVLGGGVSHMGPLFWGPLRREMRRRVFRPFARGWDLVPAGLGDETVVIGGVLLGQRAGKSQRHT